MGRTSYFQIKEPFIFIYKVLQIKLDEVSITDLHSWSIVFCPEAKARAAINGLTAGVPNAEAAIPGLTAGVPFTEAKLKLPSLACQMMHLLMMLKLKLKLNLPSLA